MQLVRDDGTQRLVVRAINEGGYAYTDVDLLELVVWLHGHEPRGVNIGVVASALRERACRREVGDRPANTEEDIVITPEMIEAGVYALHRHLTSWDDASCEEQARALAAAFAAMQRVCP